MQRTKRCKNRKCPLIDRIEVPYSGNKEAEIVIIGESPGFDEERVGQPFVGRAGQKINGLLRNAAGLNRGVDFFVANSARCLIDKKKMTNKEIALTLSCCRKNVVTAISAIKPKLIICLGDFALRQILKKSGVTKARGKFVFSPEFHCWVMPTFHPAYLLRNEAMTPQVEEDLALVAEFKKNGYKPIENDEDVDYQEAQSIADLPFQKESMAISIDSETQGKEWLSPDWVFLSYQISWETGVARMIRFHEETTDKPDFTITVMRKGDGKKKIPTEVGVKRCRGFDRKLSELKALLENKNIKKRMMTTYDLHAFDQLFIRAGEEPPVLSNFVMDVQTASNLIDENLYKRASLETLQRSFTNYKGDYNRNFEAKFGKDDMLSVPLDEFINYGCADADVTQRSADKLKTRLLKPLHRNVANYYVRFTMPVLRKTIYSLERNGTYIDMTAMPEVRNDVEVGMSKAEEAALKLIPRKVREAHRSDLKLTRSDLVRDTLFSRKGFGIEPLRKTKGGDAWSVDKETRMLLQEKEGVPQEAVEFIRYFDEYSEYHTLWSRYLKGFDKHIKSDGRIHSSFSMTTAVTGRLASSNPNMQNNPKRSKVAHLIRRLIAAQPGYVLLASDQEQSELRWCAHLTRDPEMIRVFRSGEDIHKNTAQDLSKKSWDKMTEKERKEARTHAKPVNFGLLFGMSAPGFVRYAKKEYGIDITEETAALWIAKFFGRYSKIRDYHRETIAFTREHGFIDSPLGRRRRLPEINSDDMDLRGEAERQAVNHPIQSPSSDVVLLAHNTLFDMQSLADMSFDHFRLVLFVHDELVFEVREDLDISKYVKRVKEAMENPPLERDFGIKMLVPLTTSPKVGHNLASMKEFN